MKIIALIAIFSMFGLSGCATTQTIKVLSVPVEEVPLSPPAVRKLELQDINWFIVTPENIDEVFAKLKDQRKDVVLFGLTDDGYKAISLNLGQIRELIAQQQAIIEAYKEYYKETQKRIGKQKDDYNEKLTQPIDDNATFDLGKFIENVFR